MRQIIAQRYHILEELGQGGMGTVYRGLDNHTKQTIAIKQLKPELTTPELVERFIREGTALRELNHPNIVKMLDSVEEDSNHYLIIEYLAGGDLSDLLKTRKMPVEKVLQLAIDICDALTRAHRLDIIHRDLKPANVLLAEDGTPRLTDFGIARISKQERVTATDAIVGTVDYLAPEALDGSDIDARADIWAFGVMLFEILAGERPFKGVSVAQTLMAIVTQPVPDLEALRPDAPVALIDLIYRMLEKSRDARIRSVRQVGLELEDILHGRTHQTPPETRFAPETPNLLIRPKHNLPAQTTPFVGRESELTELAKLLNDSKIRLVTILAPGGMGKSRLALEVAEQQLTHFENGVYFVELAPLADSANIVSAIAEATSYQFQSDGREPKQQILDFLANKNILLVLDNFEHLLEGAPLVTDILKAAPQVKILATSRQRLNQSGETLFNLEGMDFPAWETPADALEYAAVKLFLQSAKRAKPDFDITSDNMDAIARICKLVQGMPLGIVLAAAWLSMLSPEEIASEIVKGIDFLESELSDLPERHQSIRAVFDYSWDLLTDDEKQVFMKLSVFRGGFTRDAAEAVAGANLRLLMSLMNKSLIRRDSENGRYEVHELLRQYAEQQLESSVWADEAHSLHMQYYADFMQQCWRNIKYRRQAEALKEIATDFDNVQNAVSYAIVRHRWIALDQMLDALTFFCDVRHYYITGERLLYPAQQILNALKDDRTERILGRVISRYTWMLEHDFTRRNAETIRNFYAQSLAIAHKHDNILEVAYSHQDLGNMDYTYPTALSYLEESLRLFQELDDDFYLGRILSNLGGYYHYNGIHHLGLQYYEMSIPFMHKVGNKHGLAWTLNTIGSILFSDGRFQESEALLHEAGQFHSELMITEGIVWNDCLLSELLSYKGDFNTALLLAEKALQLATEKNCHEQVALTTLGLIWSLRGDNWEKAHSFCHRSHEIDPDNVWTAGFCLQWGLSLIEINRNKYETALRHNYKALKFARIAPVPTIVTIVIQAMIMSYLGNQEQAVKLLSLAFYHPVAPLTMLNNWVMLNNVRKSLEAELGKDGYNAAWERGKALDLKTVVQELLNESGEDA